jgi:2-methylcitrate dehydratase
MPYVVAAALLDGEVVPHSFADHKLKDPAMTQMIQKVRVNEAADISARFPESWSTRIRVRHRSGDEAVHEVRYPKGHFNDPLSDRELETKFRGMFRGFGDDMQCQAVLDALWQFDRARDVGEILTALQRKS